tara:strand:- start:4234 stop:4476 length:243 start_codon:yes stop_codon:yes gene_type:complete
MIPILIYITEYNKESNSCKARLQDNKIIVLDPFVSCAIELSDDDCNNGEGHSIVGKTYILTEYSVYKSVVIPDENGMVEL